ncbi:ABC transporter permease [Pseudonocardia nematodicida]|uniref:ABC transporter permease n=1 Tax=Pseudonocardia nematodicida TaxID=1206997 RepID=A0ABV1KCW7_9PSEU
MIAWANLRTRWRELVATLLAVAVGVGLLGAVLLCAAAARPAVQDRFAETAALVVPPRVAESRTPRTHGWVPWSGPVAEELAAGLAAAPGVTAAVVDRTFPAVPMPGGRPWGDPENAEGGHGIASLALGGYRVLDGRPPRASGEAVVDRSLGVAPGDTLPVLFADALRPVRVTGISDAPGVHLTDDEAARLAPGARTIGVFGAVPPAPPGATVLTGDERGAVEPVQDARIRYRGDQLLGVLGLLTGVTTVVVVSAAVATTVAGRRRELGLLRAAGATPAQVRRTVLGEVALTGAAGSLVGMLAATGIAPWLHRLLVDADATRPAPVGPAPGPLLVAGAVGVTLAVAGGLLASRAAAAAAPLDAIGDRAPERPVTRTRLGAGLVALGASAGLAVLTAGTDGDGRIGAALATGATLVVAAALLAPLAVVAPLGRWAGGPGAGATAMLVRAELSDSPRRTAAVAAPVIVAVGFAVLIGGLVDTMAAAYPAERTAALAGTVAVEQDGAPGLPDSSARALAVPGARIPLPTVLTLPGPAGPVAVDAVGSDDPTLVRPGETVLSEPAAARLGVAAGDVLPARFADGVTVGLRVSRVLPPDERRGDVAIARADARAHDPGALTDTAFLPATAVPVRLPTGAVARDAQAYALADYAVDARLTGALAAMLVAVSAGYGGIAVVNGIATTVRSRRPDLAVLAAAGATRRRLAGLVALESACAVGLGAVLGLAAALPPLAAVASGLSVATGAPVRPVLDPALPVVAVGICLVAAAGAGAIATVRTTRPG